MNELISKAGNIERIESLMPNGEKLREDPYKYGISLGLTMAKVATKEMPSVQLEPHWIPCSERLPEEHKMVLICKQKRNHPFIWTRETEQIDVAWRDIEGRSGDTMWQTRYFEWIHDDKVIAWMPLPEPYKEGEQNG